MGVKSILGSPSTTLLSPVCGSSSAKLFLSPSLPLPKHIKPALMPSPLVERIRSLTAAIYVNDPDLWHLEPMLTAKTTTTSTAAQALLWLVDDDEMDQAFEQLREAIRSASNTVIQRITLPSSFLHLSETLHACAHLQSLQRIDIVDNGDTTIHPALSIRCVFSLLERSRILQHLSIANPVWMTQQEEINQLASACGQQQLPHLQSLSLRLFVRSNRNNSAVNLDALLATFVGCTALQTLTLHWDEDERPMGSTTPIAPTLSPPILARLVTETPSLTRLTLPGFRWNTSHVHAVTEAIVVNQTLAELVLPCHCDSTLETALERLRLAVEKHNCSLHNLSLVTPPATAASSAAADPHATSPFRPTLSHPPTLLDALTTADWRTTRTSSSHQACWQIQQQIDIYCRLNKLGRAKLMQTTTTARDWMEMLIQCNNNGNDTTHTALSSCVYRQLLLTHQPAVTGLNETFTLLRLNPGLCRASLRTDSMAVPAELTRSHPPVGPVDLKELSCAGTSVANAVTYSLQQQQQEAAAAALNDSSSSTKSSTVSIAARVGL